jgi:hypothetical protein
MTVGFLKVEAEKDVKKRAYVKNLLYHAHPLLKKENPYQLSAISLFLLAPGGFLTFAGVLWIARLIQSRNGTAKK